MAINFAQYISIEGAQNPVGRHPGFRRGLFDQQPRQTYSAQIQAYLPPGQADISLTIFLIVKVTVWLGLGQAPPAGSVHTLPQVPQLGPLLGVDLQAAGLRNHPLQDERKGK